MEDQYLTIKAVIVYDDDGNYFIHGTNKDDAASMFKAMAGIWQFDPSKELAQQIELNLRIPVVGSLMRPSVSDHGNSN